VRAWASMFFVDHGFFRYLYLNRHRVGEQAWRAAQPAPHHIRRMANDGIRTVINLRGGREFGSYPLEREACEEAGINFEEIVLRSRAAPDPQTLLAVRDLLNRIEYPVLFHCKSGADRAGLMSALYLLLHEGRTIEEAKDQLSLRFGHIRQGKTGILDQFLETYERDAKAAEEAGRTLPFIDWATTQYDPEALKTAFTENRWASFFVDYVLRRE